MISSDSGVIEDTNFFTNLDKNAVGLSFADPNGSGRTFNICYNPNESNVKVDFDDTYRLIVDENGYKKESKKYFSSVILTPFSVYVFEGK